MTKERYYEEILKLIGEDKTEYALDLLEQCAKEYKIDGLIQYIVQYKARISRVKTEKLKGTIELSQYNIEKNQLNDAIIKSIEVLREEPIPLIIGESVRYGRIAHNIPPTMSRGVAKTCKVRIAKADKLLFDKHFPKSSANESEKLEVTERMEVELYDPTGGKAFAIEIINREVDQIVEDHAPTEWKFRVTPLLEGAHELLLRAYIFKQKGKKELSFDAQVEVVAYDGEFYAKSAITPWRLNEQVIDLGEKSEKKSMKGLFMLLASSSLAKAAALIGMLLLSGLGYLKYKNWHKPTTSVVVSKFPIKLKIDPKLKVNTVLLTNDVITDWTANLDTSEIYLSAQRKGKYFVTVKGENGVCSKLVDLSLDSSFTLDCNIIEPSKPPIKPEPKNSGVVPPTNSEPSKPKPQSIPRFDISVVTPFRLPTILVNGQSATIGSSIPEGKSFRSIINLEKGKYKISAIDRSNLYGCYDTIPSPGGTYKERV